MKVDSELFQKKLKDGKIKPNLHPKKKQAIRPLKRVVLTE